MLFDQLLLDLLDFIRRRLFARKRATRKPYSKISSERGHLGYLHEIRRDTPREVATWIFQPFRDRKNSTKDVYVFLDLLLPSDRAPGKRGKTGNTHRITVLLADHWLKEGGEWEGTILYSGEWDFQGTGRYPERYARSIAFQTARLLLSLDYRRISWRDELGFSARNFMGSDYC